ncbi:MAG TPA: hypothetical protein VGD54_19130, partial [Steroidobacteraceae bacterium]
MLNFVIGARIFGIPGFHMRSPGKASGPCTLAQLPLGGIWLKVHDSPSIQLIVAVLDPRRGTLALFSLLRSIRI